MRKRLASGEVKEFRYDGAGEPRSRVATVGALLTAYRGSPELRALATATRV